jgi:hypothetical protein
LEKVGGPVIRGGQTHKSRPCVRDTTGSTRRVVAVDPGVRPLFNRGVILVTLVLLAAEAIVLSVVWLAVLIQHRTRLT